VELLPFTSDSAEFNALRSGELDYGYVPLEDVSERAALAKKGFRYEPWKDWGISFIVPNYLVPTAGPILKQLYIRQAMQRLINQPELVRTALFGVGQPTYGPIPVVPSSPWTTSNEFHNPYPYSLSVAKGLLRSHGWTVVPNGVDACIKPGTGKGECGAGIKKGAQLNFTEQYASGVVTFSNMVEAMKSAWSQAGIDVTITSAPTGTVVTTAYSCAAVPSECRFDFENWADAGFSWTYGYYPTGEDLFKTGGGSNPDGYSNQVADADILATELQPGSGNQAIDKYENYLELQLPALWEPAWPNQLSEISSKLHGAVPQDPNVHFYPELWTLSR
jgi:peptide/nickel transport system substrate-binding protein